MMKMMKCKTWTQPSLKGSWLLELSAKNFGGIFGFGGTLIMTHDSITDFCYRLYCRFSLIKVIYKPVIKSVMKLDKPYMTPA